MSGPELLLLTGLLVLAAVTLTWIQAGATLETETGVATSPAGPTTAIVRENPAVAVLPFENISPDPDDAFFAAGMHEEIITHLAGISGLDVISRTSVLPYASGDKSLRQIATELSVDLILEGSARRAGDGPIGGRTS